MYGGEGNIVYKKYTIFYFKLLSLYTIIEDNFFRAEYS